MKVYETLCTAKVDVICNHPDDSSNYYNFVIVADEWEIDFNEVRKEIEKQVNDSGYWHEVLITLTYIIDGKQYKQEI